MERKLVIIGSGPSGMQCAISATEQGVLAKDILIIERETTLGGTINQSNHQNFGHPKYGNNLTGPQLAEKMAKKIKKLGIEYITDSTVLSFDKNKQIKVVSPKYGYCIIQAEAIVLAMGCREKSKGALTITGTRPEGVLSAGTMQRLINVDKYLPGKRTVVLGSANIALFVARRIELAGGTVVCVCEPKKYSDGSEENIKKCLENNNIPLNYSYIVNKIFGDKCVEAVEISKANERGRAIKNTGEVVECDSFVYSCGLVPENELSKSAGIVLDRRSEGPKVNQYLETSVRGIFACGNVLRIHDLLTFIIEEGEIVGKNVAKYLIDPVEKPKKKVRLLNGERILYTVPQRLDIDEEGIVGETVYFRVNGKYDNIVLHVSCDGKTVYKRKKGKMSSMQTGKILIDEELAKKIANATEVIVYATDKKSSSKKANKEIVHKKLKKSKKIKKGIAK